MGDALGKDALVVFSPSGKRGRFPRATPVLDAARSLGVDIDSVCGGRAMCGRCQVVVAEGEFAKHNVVSKASNLSPAGEAEQRFREGRAFAYVLHDGQPAIRILQSDVRAIQLAKAALYAGARLLMKRYGIDKVDRIRLAGAFGAYIDGKHAMVLGLITDCDLGRVSSAGNAAGTGAGIALLDRNARPLIETQVRKIEKIETATADGFQDHFVAAMSIPHNTDGFDELAKVVELPAARKARATGRKKRRLQ